MCNYKSRCMCTWLARCGCIHVVRWGASVYMCSCHGMHAVSAPVHLYAFQALIVCDRSYKGLCMAWRPPAACIFVSMSTERPDPKSSSRSSLRRGIHHATSHTILPYSAASRCTCASAHVRSIADFAVPVLTSGCDMDGRYVHSSALQCTRDVCGAAAVTYPGVTSAGWLVECAVF